MNIQIFGRSKCFDTKKAERYFKERRIRVQQIDLLRYGMSGGEFDSVLRAVGGVDKLIDWSRRDPDIDLLRYMDDVRAKEDKLFERPELMRTPVVRNGRKATVGYCPDVWKQWEESENEAAACKTHQEYLLCRGLCIGSAQPRAEERPADGAALAAVRRHRPAGAGLPCQRDVLPLPALPPGAACQPREMDDCPYCKLPLRDTK